LKSNKEKVKYDGLDQENGFAPAHLVCLLTRRSKAVHLLEKSVINMICLLLPVFDWPNIMIGADGFATSS
jgi:hypothetical protein